MPADEHTADADQRLGESDADPVAHHALEGAARAVRRLVAALVARDADPATLKTVIREADHLTGRLEALPRRSRAASFRERYARFAAAASDPDAPPRVPDGARVGLFPLSPVGGTAHPGNLGLAVHREGDVAVGQVVFDAAAEAAPGRVHGGLIAACVDEMFAGLLMVVETFAFTGELSIRYLGPCSIGEPIEFRAWVAGREGRRLDLRCTATATAATLVEARGVGIAVDPARLQW